ncbi:MAG: transglycosylase domain-containing protein [Anaerolineales bacterium]|nr:transglycosylase domain-containing protein [Anaerolineales bacterium]
MKRRLLLLALLLALAAGAGLYAWLFGDLPDPASVSARGAVPSVRIVDRHGRLLYDLLDADTGRHTSLPLAQIPLPLQQATIATEDKNFYHNPGVDLQGILRAFWINLRGGEVLAGGSTITQQVARNLLLDADERAARTVRRKLRESWLAWRVARRLEKDDILALYLNQMYYGALAYGVEAAAQTYFGRPAADLTLAQSALIAGLTQAPALYNPFVAPEAAKARQLVVLDLMHQEGYIDDDAHALAVREPLAYNPEPYPVRAPHFVQMVQAELDALLPPEARLAGGGLVVRTTLDLTWQEPAETIIAAQLDRLNHPPGGAPSHNAHNAALVALDPHTGEVLALVGSPDYFDAGIGGAINMALTPRQPGSALKPLVYAAALAPGSAAQFTAATMLPDVRTVFLTHDDEPYVPVNFSRDEHGPVLLRQALGSSLNIPAVLATDAVGVAPALAFAEKLGITTLGDPDAVDLSFALGGGAVRLLDLTAAYAAFANGGYRIAPRLILDVRDARGELLHTAVSPTPTQVMDPRVAWLISDILSDDDARLLGFGADSLLNIGRTAAAKTGTTNDFHDNWTVGYTPNLVAGVWVGNAGNEPMHDVTGLSGAGPIWHHFMRAVLAGQPDQAFAQPDGLVAAEVCALSGLLPTDACPYRLQEWFLAGTEPTEPDTFYRLVELDGATGLPATAATPAGRRQPTAVLDLPPLFHNWARAEGLLLLDDVLQAGGAAVVEETAGSAAPTLQLVAPDANTTYRLSPALPADAQRLRLAAAAGSGLRQLTLWLDGHPLAAFDAPPYEAWWPLAAGVHQAWVTAVDAAGSPVESTRVTFTVMPAEE